MSRNPVINYLRLPRPHGRLTSERAIIVLGTQRCGSTVLCRDIASVGALGSPSEIFLLLNKGGFRNKSVDAALKRAQDESGFFAVKLMLNYLHLFGAWVTSNKYRGTEDGIRDRLRLDALDFFRTNFMDPIFILSERENAIDQAYSRYRAQRTGKYHSFDGIKGGAIDVDLDVAAIIHECANVISEKQELRALLKTAGIEPLTLHYSEIAGNFPDYLTHIMDASGLPAERFCTPRRTVEKIVTSAEAENVRMEVLKAIDASIKSSEP